MGNASVQRGLFLTFRLLSLIRHALRRATFPVGEGDLRRGLSYPLLGEGGWALGPDGCGAGQCRTWYRPSSAAWGGTFPQGKVNSFPQPVKKSVENIL